jgi:hypothetical protein
MRERMDVIRFERHITQTDYPANRKGQGSHLALNSFSSTESENYPASTAAWAAASRAIGIRRGEQLT